MAIGLAGNAEGQIFVKPQGMCVIAGISVEDGRAGRAGLDRRALAALRQHLATPHDVMLHQPACTRFRARLGESTSYPPGYKENGGIFCRTNPWVMITETTLGYGDAVLDHRLRTCPSAREAISDVTEASRTCMPR